MQPSEDLWKQLHHLLHKRDRLRFPLPLDECSDCTFSYLFTSKQPSVHLVLDDAYALRAMPQQAIASFLSTMHMLREYRIDATNRGSLASMTLLGEAGLASVLLNTSSWEYNCVPCTMVSSVASRSQSGCLCQIHLQSWSETCASVL